MTIVVLENCPQSLRGDMTKWLMEINTSVYVGDINARVRDKLWDRICSNIRQGKATMVWSSRGEQGMNFRVHNTTWQPVDYDGIKLMMRPLPGSKTTASTGSMRSGFSNAAKARVIQRAEAKRYASTRAGAQPDVCSAHDTEDLDEAGYVVIDVETTGLDIASDSILEIGALKVRGGVPDTEFVSLIKCDESVPDEVVRLTGITDEMLLDDGISIESAMRKLVDFIADERIVCHNAKFDIGFLQAAARKCGITIMHGNKCEDTLALARRKIRGVSSFKLVDIAKYFMLDTAGSHRAMKDCYLTHFIYEKLKKK